MSTWLALRKQVAAGAFSRQEVTRFSVGMALWILIPCLILWALQLSIAGESTPLFTMWPTPQRYFALGLQVFVWAALLYWVFLREGAATVSKYRTATAKAPSFFTSPMAIKVGAIAVVAAGIFALISQNA